MRLTSFTNDNPQLNKNYLGFETLRLVYGLSGIVMMGLFINASEKWGKGINEEWKNTQYLRKAKRQNLPRIIEQRLDIIPTFVSREEKVKAKLPEQQKLTLLGLIALGLLSVVFPDRIGDAAIRFHAISLIFKRDPVAGLIFSKFPEIFNGYSTTEKLYESIHPDIDENTPAEELRKLLRKIEDIDRKQLEIIYNYCNL